MAETASSHRSETTHRLMRAEREFLKLVYPVTIPDERELSLLEEFRLTDECRSAVWSRLRHGGTLRTGPLFGHRLERDGLLTVTAIAEGGSPFFAAQHHPFQHSPEYLLGCSELLRQVCPAWDWHGQWVIHPSGQLGSDAWQQAVLAELQVRYLLREGLAAVFLGLEQGQLAAQAYTVLEGRLRELELAGSAVSAAY